MTTLSSGVVPFRPIASLTTQDGTTVSCNVLDGAERGIGLGIGFTAGAVGGGAQEFFNQWSNSDWDISKVRFDQVGWSALENGVFNTLSTVLGGFGGTGLRQSISFILGAQLNVIPSGYTTITDIIKWYLQKEKTA